jgi:hypothetical protein
MEIKLKKIFFLMLVPLLINCSSEKGIFFENLSFQMALEKAQQLNKSIMVDVFSDG